MAPRLCLGGKVPLFAQELDAFREFHLRLSLDAAFQAAKVRVADLLKRAKGRHVVHFSLARKFPGIVSQMDVVKQGPAGPDGFRLIRFLDIHVKEIGHDTDAGAVDLFANCHPIGDPIQKPRLVPVQWFQQYPGPAGYRVLTKKS